MGIGIIVVGFFVCRVIFLWYWRVNEIVDLLKKIEENTRDKKTEKEERPRPRMIG